MNIALILAGGTGKRLGAGMPKQYIEVKGKPVIAYCLDTFAGHEAVDGIQIVAEPVWQDRIIPFAGDKLTGFSLPGENRQLSVLNGLRDIVSKGGDRVIIHDAARPLVSAKMISDCLAALADHDGVVPVLPMKDTVYEGRDGRILSLLDRDRILAGQAPEAFVVDKYYEANLSLLPDRIRTINGSAEPAVLAGMDVACIPGDERNFKITTREDLERFRRLIE